MTLSVRMLDNVLNTERHTSLSKEKIINQCTIFEDSIHLFYIHHMYTLYIRSKLCTRHCMTLRYQEDDASSVGLKNPDTPVGVCEP